MQVKLSYVERFYKDYPKLRDQPPEWYRDKCGVISVLFSKFLLETFQIASFLVRGYGINERYMGRWIKNPQLIREIHQQHRHLFRIDQIIHVAVVTGDTVYDFASGQFYDECFTGYSLDEFRSRFLKVDFTTLEDYRDYRARWSDLLREIE